MREEHRANLENTRRRKQTKNIKENQTKEKLQKRKGAKKRREGITRRESPSPRPIKKSFTKRSKHLITGAIQILKSPPILFLPLKLLYTSILLISSFCNL